MDRRSFYRRRASEPRQDDTVKLDFEVFEEMKFTPNFRNFNRISVSLALAVVVVVGSLLIMTKTVTNNIFCNQCRY